MNHKNRIFIAVVAALLIASCTSLGVPQPSTVKEALQKSVISVHKALYLPVMAGLGLALDHGRISPAQEAKIQAASEKYVALKDEADRFISIAATDAAAENKVRDLLGQMLAEVGELQRYRSQAGGTP